ncbi:hypothetical protein P4B35_06135 [Pontiellaceae bacterium B12227]|nr:hypothetical protein [Pontiellaceae bacterium B12227]
MKQSRSLKHILRIGAWSTVLAIGLTAQAEEEFFQTSSMGVGSHWNEAFWTNAANPTAVIPSAGNTYVNSVGGNTRTPSSGDDFLGKLLTIQSGGVLQFKHGGGSSVSANVVMEDGSKMLNGGSTGKMEGTLTGSGKITIDTTKNSSRPITIGSLLKPDNTFSEFEIIGTYANNTTFTNSANTFTGVWNVASGGSLKGAGLGQASAFIISGTSGLDFDADFVNTNADITISSGGSFLLDQDVDVYTVDVWGIALTNKPGGYTGAELKAHAVYGTAFAGSSDTSILTVNYTPPPIVGDTIYQIASMGAAASLGWNDTNYWDNGQALVFSNDYVNAGANWDCRTPASGSDTFVGNSLTITNGAKLAIKNNGPWTVDDLRIWAGSQLRLAGGWASSLSGALSLKGTGSILFEAGNVDRKCTISSLIYADSTVTNITVRAGSWPSNTAHAATAGFTMNGVLNDFDGLWTIESGLLAGNNLGGSGFLVTDFGTLDFDADYENNSADLTIEANPTNSAQGGMILLDQNVIVGSATIWEETLADGLYWGVDLKAHPIYGGAFDPTSSDGAYLIVGSTATAPITQIEGHVSADLQAGWLTTNSWSNGEVPSPAYHYLNNTSGWDTRSPVNAVEPSPVFMGKSLTITDGANFVTKHGGTAMVSNLNMFAGTNLKLVGSHGIDGNIDFKGSGTINMIAGSENRKLTVHSLVTAAEGIDTMVLTVKSEWDTNTIGNTGFIFNNTSNTFTGTWDVEQGMLRGGGLGQSSFVIGEEGFLYLDTDFYNTNGTLTIEANPTNSAVGGTIRLALSKNMTVAEATIWGVELADGTYTAAQLMADPTYGAAIHASSTGSLTVQSPAIVIPEIGDVTYGMSGSDLVIGWQGTNVATYTLQADADLVNAPGWTNVVDISGIDGPMSVTNDTTDPKMFYRIIGN